MLLLTVIMSNIYEGLIIKRLCYNLNSMRSIGKSGFRFSKSMSGFPNRTRNPKTDFTFENLSSGWISIKESKSGFHGFLFTVRLGNPKKDCKTTLVNSGLLFAKYACACKTAVLKDSFSNLFFGFPNRTVKMKIQKQVSQRWNPFSDFAFDCKTEIRIFKI